jgi:hypothetical protein
MTEETVEPQQAPVNLQINDLVKILEILNVVSQRGAIRPDEFSTVGGIYERIFQFLDASGVFKKSEESDSEKSTDQTQSE